MIVLNHTQILQKIKRLAYQILEKNYSESQIIIAGINIRGMHFAKLIVEELKQISQIPIELTCIHINPANPLGSEIKIEKEVASLQDKAVIIIDDVANSGRTIFYACKPILDVLPKKIEVAVLVDRMHKLFPVKADYVGLSLATTHQQNISAEILNKDDMAVYLV